jgi:16S rRNA (adenine1518-N6/adenine1519-N6)-dimethyltransferase
VPKSVEPNPQLFEVAKLLFMHKNKKVINALIDSRHLMAEKDKDKLRDKLPGLLGTLGDKKVFYLEIEEIIKIKDKINNFITVK